MSDLPEIAHDGPDRDAAGQLLRLAGPRAPVPAHREARVRAAVHGEWQARRRRAKTNRFVALSVLLTAAATLAVMAIRLKLVDHNRVAPAERVAFVEEITGTPQRVGAARGQLETPLARGDAVHTGEWIQTDADARVALRLLDGTSLRLDVGSRARSISLTVIELTAGAAYVDTGRESGRFEVRTPVAIARDLGTQFEVRLLDRSLRLRVRSGLVVLHDGSRTVSGRAGTEIMFADGVAASRPFAPDAPEWAWTTRVSPPLTIEGVALSVFLDRITREHGWTLHYADSALAKEAAGIILHGTVDGLAAREAVDVAIAASNLRHRFDGAHLFVFGDTVR